LRLGRHWLVMQVRCRYNVPRAVRHMLAAAMMLSVGGCAGVPLMACGPGQKDMLVAELLFGRNVGDRLAVSSKAFGAFIDEEVTPRFPAGLTILDGIGQYRDAGRGVVVREPSKIVVIAVSDNAETRQNLAAVAEAYKRRFDQQSVGTILRPACVSF
jgi:hypothetical protein